MSPAEDLALGYRTSRFRSESTDTPTEVILSAELALRAGSRDAIRARMACHTNERRASQPWLPSAGSVFKNPPGDYAARLIEAAGLKGEREGDAMIATEHANFIVNIGKARSSDVRMLVDRIRTTVSRRFGVDLQLEIQLVGDWHGSCD